MPSSISSIVARGNNLLRRADHGTMSDTTLNLLISLLVLLFAALCLGGALIVLRRVRRKRAFERQLLPTYNESTGISCNGRPVSSHRRSVNVSAGPFGRASSIFIYDDEKSAMMDSPSTSPSSVPEIRITFPDEQDESGRAKSGRVVIVRVGENGVGLEPVQDEQLPAYQKESSEQFHSIDMESIGGLKEIHQKDQYS